MTKNEYVALIFRRLFETNNLARKKAGWPLMTWEKLPMERLSWGDPGLRESMQLHAEAIYNELQSYLTD